MVLVLSRLYAQTEFWRFPTGSDDCRGRADLLNPGLSDFDRAAVSTYRSLRYRGIAGALLGVLLLASTSIASATTYRWRDAEGVMHFADRPPPGVEVEPVKVNAQPSPLSPTQAGQAIQTLRAQEAARQQDEAAETAASAPAPALAAKRENCARAEWALSALETAHPVYRDEQGMYRIKRPPGQVDAYTGERSYLDDASRAREIGVQQKLIQTNCGAQPTAEEKAVTAEQILTAEHCEAAAADLETLLSSGGDRNLIDSRQEFLDANCALP